MRNHEREIPSTELFLWCLSGCRIEKHRDFPSVGIVQVNDNSGWPREVVDSAVRSGNSSQIWEVEQTELWTVWVFIKNRKSQQ